MTLSLAACTTTRLSPQLPDFSGDQRQGAALKQEVTVWPHAAKLQVTSKGLGKYQYTILLPIFGPSLAVPQSQNPRHNTIMPAVSESRRARLPVQSAQPNLTQIWSQFRYIGNFQVPKGYGVLGEKIFDANP